MIDGKVGPDERSDWRYLHDAILDGLPNRPVTGAREPSRPRAVRTWEVRVSIEGLNDRAAWVITSWRMVDERPVLVSARVARKVVKIPAEAYDRRPDGTPST